MAEPPAIAVNGDVVTSNQRLCPSWCVAVHGLTRGEEDWLHMSEDAAVVDGVPTRLVMSTDPATCEVDGPFVMVGDTELTPAQAAALATSLLALVSSAQRSAFGIEPHADLNLL